jgi:3-hydroxyisobutyrate dehydrogenase-like beta-hydroxyacid dehydrogenase
MLAVLAKNALRVGDAPGQGQAMKLINNFLGAAALAATSEAVVFGVQAGLDLKTMIEVINVSTGRSVASADKFPRSIVPRTYDFGFAGALMAKDMRLYLESVAAAGVPHEIASGIADLWQRYSEACPGTDFTYIHKYLEDMAARPQHGDARGE